MATIYAKNEISVEILVFFDEFLCVRASRGRASSRMAWLPQSKGHPRRHVQTSVLQAFRPCDLRIDIHKRFRARPVGSPSSRVRGTIGHEEISKHHAGDVQFCPQSTNALVAPLGHPIGSLWS